MGAGLGTCLAPPAPSRSQGPGCCPVLGPCFAACRCFWPSSVILPMPKHPGPQGLPWALEPLPVGQRETWHCLNGFLKVIPHGAGPLEERGALVAPRPDPDPRCCRLGLCWFAHLKPRGSYPCSVRGHAGGWSAERAIPLGERDKSTHSLQYKQGSSGRCQGTSPSLGPLSPNVPLGQHGTRKASITR